MVRMSRISLLALLSIPLAACTAKVVRQENGWREVEGREAGKTQVEVTTDDPQVLADLARSAPDVRVRLEAQRRVADPAVLEEIARSEQDPALRLRIVGRLIDEGVLRSIAQKDADDRVRLAAASRADTLKTVDVRHPEYAGWASCKPGTWVKLKVDLKVDDSKSSVEIVRTLLECGPEKAVLEQKVVATGRPVEGTAKELLGRFDVAYGRKVEDDGDLQLQGRTIRCKWVKYNFQKGSDVGQVRRWLREDVPGGVARIDMEVSPEGRPLSQLTAQVTGWEKR